jgi:hypothetical protein
VIDRVRVFSSINDYMYGLIRVSKRMYSYRMVRKVGEVFSLLDIFLEYNESHHVHGLK